MLRKFFKMFLCTFLVLSSMCGCRSQRLPASDGTTETPTQSKTDEPVTPPEVTEPNLRVLSFNVRMDFLPTSGLLSGVSRNRVQAVREQILSYEPDVFGLQEDVQRWIDNIDISTEDYTVYRPDEVMRAASMEYCSIYVKKGITVKDHGWKWITSTGTNASAALTYEELTDGDGKYDMNVNDLINLGVFNDATLKAKYTDPETGQNYANLLAARLMNWVVLEINGKDVIYVNTHLQHRGYSEAEYDEHPVYMLRYYERCAQFDMVQAQIEALKQIYPEASVILTADFNDTSKSGFYAKVAESYTDSMFAAKRGTKLENSWNSAYVNDKQGQGYVSPNENKIGGRIDFCFVSDDLAERVFLYQLGACKWTLKESEFTLSTNVDVYPSDHLPVIVDIGIG